MYIATMHDESSFMISYYIKFIIYNLVLLS